MSPDLDPVLPVARAVQEQVEPAGLRRTVRDGERWSWAGEHDGATLLVDVQFSPHPRWMRVGRVGHGARAAVNLGVRHPVVDLAFDRALSTGAWAVEGHVWTRLGMLLPAGVDTWWAGAEAPEAAAAMQAQGLPWLRSHADPRRALATLEQEGDGLGALELAVVLGDREAARRAADRCRELTTHHTDAGARTEFERRWRDALARLDVE